MKHIRLAFGLLACFAAFVVIGWGLPRLLADRCGPRLECSTAFDLGECEAGAMITQAFSVRNAGDAPLHLYAIRSSCGCAGISRRVGGEFERVTAVEIPPDSTEELFIRVRVSVIKDASGVFTVTFLTNDPTQPEGKVSLNLCRALSPLELRPPELSLGRLEPSRPHRFTVEVFDDPMYQRSISDLRSSLPDCVRVRFFPSEKAPNATGSEPSSVKLGQIEVVVESDQPVELLGEVTLLSSDEMRAPVRLGVSGAVRPWLEFHPTRVLLRRRSSEGWISQSTVVCRFPAGVSGTVEVGSNSAGLHATAKPVGDLWHVTLRVDLEKIVPGEELVVPLRWRATGRSGTESLRVHVNSAYPR